MSRPLSKEQLHYISSIVQMIGMWQKIMENVALTNLPKWEL